MEPASAASSSKPPQRQSCRVCSDEEDVFAQMRRTMYAEARKKDKKPKQQQQSSTPTEQHKHSEQQSNTTATATTATTSAAGAIALTSTSTQQPVTTTTTSTASSSPPPFLGAGHPLPCPPDATRLGRSTWTFLHTMAAYYPAHPTPTQQQHATHLLHSLSSLYPCEHCATHLTSYYRTHPPERAVSGRSELSAYLCHVHNDVRARQQKRLFDCGRVLERWGGHDWDDKHDDKACDEREYGDVEDEA